MKSSFKRIAIKISTCLLPALLIISLAVALPMLRFPDAGLIAAFALHGNTNILDFSPYWNNAIEMLHAFRQNGSIFNSEVSKYYTVSHLLPYLLWIGFYELVGSLMGWTPGEALVVWIWILFSVEWLVVSWALAPVLESLSWNSTFKYLFLFLALAASYFSYSIRGVVPPVVVSLWTLSCGLLFRMVRDVNSGCGGCCRQMLILALISILACFVYPFLAIAQTVMLFSAFVYFILIRRKTEAIISGVTCIIPIALLFSLKTVLGNREPTFLAEQWIFQVDRVPVPIEGGVIWKRVIFGAEHVVSAGYALGISLLWCTVGIATRLFRGRMQIIPFWLTILVMCGLYFQRVITGIALQEFHL